MFSITSQQGKANPNHNETSPHTCQDHYYQKHERQALARVWGTGNPCTVLVAKQNGAVTTENGTESPQKMKNRTAIRSGNPSAGYLSKIIESKILKRY